MTAISDQCQRILALRRMLVYRDTKLGRFRCMGRKMVIIINMHDIVMSVNCVYTAQTGQSSQD